MSTSADPAPPAPADGPTPHQGGRGRWTRRRQLAVQAGLTASVATIPLGAAACAVGGTPPPQRPAELTGTFDFFVQNFAPTVAIHEQSVAAFKEVAPQAKLNLSTVAFGEMAAKATAVAPPARAPTASTPIRTCGAG